MRLNSQSASIEGGSPDVGSLLVAHPSMLDPNFYRTVVFLAMHDSGEGSLGLIMNRPMNTTLGELDASLSGSVLSGIPLYEGGPVASDKLILAAWKWVEEQSAFQLYFGVDSNKAERLLKGDGYHVRGFMGHAGWTGGQLVAEIEEKAWLLSNRMPELVHGEGEKVWRNLLKHENPELGLFLDAPDDPSLN